MLASAFMNDSASSSTTTLFTIGTDTTTTTASTVSSTSTTPLTDESHEYDMQELQQKLQALSPDDRPNPLAAVCPRPIPNSYWADPLLLACEYPWCPDSCEKVKALLKAGVRTFIDLTEVDELIPYYPILYKRASELKLDTSSPNQEIEYHRFPIKDRCTPRSQSQVNAIMSVLSANHARGRICAVHCRGGIGRTGLVIGCYLVYSGLAKDGQEALNIIAKEWKGVAKSVTYTRSPETGPQEKFVRDWKAMGSRLLSRRIAHSDTGLRVFGRAAHASTTLGRRH